jgi:hypothetical protein
MNAKVKLCSYCMTQLCLSLSDAVNWLPYPLPLVVAQRLTFLLDRTRNITEYKKVKLSL